MTEHSVVLIERPHGAHRLLCRLGAHAWTRRRIYSEGVPTVAGATTRVCAVCGRRKVVS